MIRSRYATSVSLSGMITQEKVQTVVLSVQELCHTYLRKSLRNSVSHERLSATSTALPFYSGSWSQEKVRTHTVISVTALLNRVVPLQSLGPNPSAKEYKMLLFLSSGTWVPPSLIVSALSDSNEKAIRSLYHSAHKRHKLYIGESILISLRSIFWDLSPAHSFRQWCNQDFFQDQDQDQDLDFETKTKTLKFFQDKDQDQAQCPRPRPRPRL